MGLRKLLSHVAVLGVVAVAIACAASPSERSAVEPAYPYERDAITVVGAENFYADLLHQLGGARLKVYSILSDPSADPHQYESGAGDARAVADARLLIVNGLGYDAFMYRLLRASPSSSRVVINVQALVGAADGGNPHLWYDPGVMPKVAQAAAAALQRLDPVQADTYTAGLRSFTQALAPLDAAVGGLRSKYRGAPVALTEPVFGYMADAIGLVVKTPVAFMKAVEEGNDPPAGAVAEMQNLITRQEVKVLLYNRQAVTRVTTSIKDLATRSGVPVVGVSETQPPGTTFQDWQLKQLKAIAAALGG